MTNDAKKKVIALSLSAMTLLGVGAGKYAYDNREHDIKGIYCPTTEHVYSASVKGNDVISIKKAIIGTEIRNQDGEFLGYAVPEGYVLEDPVLGVGYTTVSGEEYEIVEDYIVKNLEANKEYELTYDYTKTLR